MIALLDSSILVAAAVEAEEFHGDCLSLLNQRGLIVNPHALAETFNTLTGGRAAARIAPEFAARVIEVSLLPSLTLQSLSGADMVQAIRTAHRRGVRGGAIYDYLHMVTARAAGAAKLYTLNTSHFLAFHRRGDPEIAHPRA